MVFEIGNIYLGTTLLCTYSNLFGLLVHPIDCKHGSDLIV
mgnify:CR=1 FL=1